MAYLLLVLISALFLKYEVHAETTEELVTDSCEWTEWVNPPEPVGILQKGQLFPTSETVHSPEKQRQLASIDSEAMESLKQTLYLGMKERKKTINVSKYKISFEELWDVFNQVFYTHADLFFVDWTSGGNYAPGGSYAGTIDIVYDSRYTVEDEASFAQTCDRIIAEMPSELTQEQKILYLHDYLVTHCQYDIATLSNIENGKFNAYNALVEGSAVCQGYALAYAHLCKLAGIQAYHVTSVENEHAWNMVVIDGVYYYVDCTWDDPFDDDNNQYYYDAFCKHEYFLLSRDSMVKKGHEISKADWTEYLLGNVHGYAINSTKYEDAYWTNVITPISFAGNVCAYTYKDDRDHVYLRDVSENEVAYALPVTASWYVWGKPRYYTTSYMTVVAVNGNYYASAPDRIYRITSEGVITEFYHLTVEEATQGYIYGIISDGDEITYSLGTYYKTADGFLKKTIKVQEEKAAVIRSGQAGFEGRLELFFNLVFSDALLEDPGAFVELAGEQNLRIPLSQGASQVTADGEQRYQFGYPLYANEIRENITLKVYDGDGHVVSLKNKAGDKDFTENGFTYSLYTYATNMLSSSDPAMAALALATIDYCTAAQIYFGYEAEGLISDVRVTNIKPETLEPYAPVSVGDKLSGVEKRTLAGSFEADNMVCVSYYFMENVDVKNYVFLLDGIEVTPIVENNAYRIMVKGVDSDQLDESHEFTLRLGEQDWSVSASVMSYARTSVNQVEDSNRVNLGKALYLYNVAAKAFFSSKAK